MEVPGLYSSLRLRTHRQFAALLGSIVVLAGTFIIDISTPRGVAAGAFPYFIGLLLTASIPYLWAPYGFAAAASALTIAGYYVTTGFIGWVVLSNRISLVAVYWVVAFLVYRLVRHDGLEAAQEALASSRDQLQLVIDSLPVMILYLDAQGRFRFANKTCSTWYARPLDEIIGKPIQDVLAGEYDRVAPRIDRALQGEAQSLEETITHPDGVTRSIRATYVPHFGPDGAVEGFFALVEDVSEQKLNEDQLRQAQRMEAVGQLTGGVAHDFNNLLAVLMGNLELALMRLPTNNDLKPMLDSAMQAAERGGALTGQLLAFSRRQNLAPAPTDINELADRVLQLARRTLGEPVLIDFEPQENLWQANIDAARLENVLLNLALNARDAMPEGGTLSVKTYDLFHSEDSKGMLVVMAPGDYVVVEVNDTGIGMSKEVAEKAFEPFFTTKEAGLGSGLGLSMAYGFVKQSGGHIDIRSAPGQGTTIRLFLPRSDTIASPKPRAQEIEVDPENTGETVLIVEDDPHVRQLAVSIVERLGYRALQFEDAESALAAMEDGADADLILSDVVLGTGMNGVVLANQIREKYPGTNVLLMSGYATETFARDGALGDDYELISKPFKVAELKERIRGLLT